MHGEQRSFDVDVEGPVEVFLRNGTGRHELADTRIGKQDVDAPLFGLDGLVEPIEVAERADVALNAGDVGADALDRGIEFFAAAAHDEYVGPFGDETSCCGEPHS